MGVFRHPGGLQLHEVGDFETVTICCTKLYTLNNVCKRSPPNIFLGAVMLSILFRK